MVKLNIIHFPIEEDDLSDYDNYWGISLINNGIKLISKIVSIKEFQYMDSRIILLDQNNLDSVIKKNVLVYLFQLEKFVKDVKTIIKKLTLHF